MLLSIGSYNIIYWAKEVCNQQTKNCEHCSVALSCNIQVCGFWLRTFLFVTFWPRNHHGLHETTFFFPELPGQLFKPHRWKCDILEANKETTIGNNMCQLLGESFNKKENMVWTNQGKSHVLEKKNQAKNFF